MKAVILCDDFSFAADAAATLARVGLQPRVNIQWTTKSWPINALKDAALAKKALAEALDSHLIVFPAQRASRLPEWVFQWLDRWSSRRTIQNAALGVIKGPNAARPADPTFPELSKFAKKHGLILLVDEGAPTRVAVHFPAERRVAPQMAQKYSTGRASQVSNRGFGIN